uniref:Crinkler family protein n=1 Tax=Mycena chlorophos TaxID=658473 RepID=A0ABQ0MCN3_MYCCL|nr:predicted protein [Mycena chlorophos]
MKAANVVHLHPSNEFQLPLHVSEEWAAEWYRVFSLQEENHEPLDVLEGGIKYVRLCSGRKEWIIERPEYPAIWQYIKEAMAQRLPLHVSEEWAAKWYRVFSPQEENRKPLDVLEGGIKYVHLRSGRKEWIIERPEYPATWQYIKEAMAQRVSQTGIGGLVIWGQPGIGKRLFLLYALALAIHEQRPAVWCDSDNEERIILFQVGRAPYALEGQTGWPADALVLVDSTGTARLVQPPAKFLRTGSRTFIVQATSPRELGCYRSWAKHKAAKMWPMDLWSAKELTALMHLLRDKNHPPPVTSCDLAMVPRDEHTRTYSAERLFELLGPSIRAIVDSLALIDTGNPQKDLAALLPPPNLFGCMADVANTVESSHANPPGFHFYFFAMPQEQFAPGKPKAQSYVNPLCEYVVPTKFLAGILLDTLKDRQWQEQYADSPHLRFWYAPQVAGALYEAAFAQLLEVNGKPLEMVFQDPSLRGVALAPPLTIHDVACEPHSGMQIGTLYAVPRGFASFDAYTLMPAPNTNDDSLLAVMLQTTFVCSHPVKNADLSAFFKALENRPDANKIRYVFVFVVPSMEIGWYWYCACAAAAVCCPGCGLRGDGSSAVVQVWTGEVQSHVRDALLQRS